MDIAKGIAGFSVDMVHAEFGWVEAPDPGIPGGVLDELLRFEGLSVQCADDGLHAGED